MKSLLQKLTTTKAKTDPHKARLDAIVKLSHDIDAATGAALAAGVPAYVVVEALERAEAGARHRMAAGLRF